MQEEDTETETVRDVDMDDEDPRERAEKEGAKPGEGTALISFYYLFNIDYFNSYLLCGRRKARE
jgi:hypothetical protein